MKTKDRLGKLAAKARMCLKTKHLSLESENVVENKGSYLGSLTALLCFKSGQEGRGF
jgi:hypothetical protein